MEICRGLGSDMAQEKNAYLYRPVVYKGMRRTRNMMELLQSFQMFSQALWNMFPGKGFLNPGIPLLGLPLLPCKSPKWSSAGNDRLRGLSRGTSLQYLSCSEFSADLIVLKSFNFG